MRKNQLVAWLLVSMVWSWIGLAAAAPPVLESTPPAAVEAPALEGIEGSASGVVIEEIPKGSTLEKAGLLVGDVITAWKRLPNLPANPEAAEGAMASYFDWQELEVEQAPRGTVVLHGQRGGEPLELTVTPGLWEAKVRPVLPLTLEAIYAAGKTHLSTGDLESAVRDWGEMAKRFKEAESTGVLRAWVALRSAEVWRDKREWEKAIAAYREAAEATGYRLAQVAIWQALGDIGTSRNNFDAADAAYTSALGILQMLRPESLSVASGLNSLGETAFARGDLDRAFDYFIRAIKMQEKLAPQSIGVAQSMNNLGAVALTRGALGQAEYYFSRALQIEEQRADQGLDLAAVLSNLGGLARARGHLDSANDYYLRSLHIEEKLAPDSLEVASSLNNLGALAFARGELEGAEGYHLRALRIREQLAPGSLDVAASLNNLGTVACSRGDLDRAHEYHLRGFKIEEYLAPESLIIAASLNNLGIVAQGREEFDRANQYHLSALRIEELLAPNSLTLANSLNNLGTVALALGETDRARRYQLRALKINEQLAPRSLEVATSLSNLGVIARDSGKLDQAHNYFNEALQIEERLAPNSLNIASSLNNLGSVAFVQKEFDDAHDYFLRALRIREELAPDSLEIAISLNNLGATALARGYRSPAHEYYHRALEALERQISKLGGSYNLQAGFRAQHRSYYLAPLALLLTQNRFAEAFQLLERFRAQTFLTMLAERDIAFTADIPEELDRERRSMSVLYDRTLKKLAGLNPRDNADEIDTTRKELQKLDDEAGDVEARVRSASPKLAALRHPQPLDAAAAQQALGPGTLLLSFSVNKDKTALFALSQSGELEVKILPLGEKALRTRVRQFLGLLQEAKQGSSLGEMRERRIEAIGRELYATLLGSVVERIAASERLLILPDGPLHSLPFAALVRDTKDGPQSLGAWKPIHVALSATVYAELKQRRRPAGEEDSQNAPLQLAAFGDPVYPQSLAALKNPSTDALPADGDSATGRGDPTVRGAAERGLFDFQPLPYTRREVLGIASLFPAGTSRTFLGHEALEERIKSLDPRTRILHLAAHGSTDEHLPSGSFIALTIPGETPSDDTAPQRDNGLLQVWEIFERVRLNADLVVLSACDTALGEELGGEGLIGLTRAFQYAGARSVLASLWSVNDQATSELMIRFYKHLLAGLPKDQALQAAQEELIRGPIEVTNERGEREMRDFSAPYYWAGFQLYGDWQ